MTSVIPTATTPIREDDRPVELHAVGSAEILARSGHDVGWSVTRGDAAHEILSAAAAYRSNLIVMGSRGLTGLSRLALGSVARNVLLHSHTSVLIVHEPVREGAPERVPAPHRVRAVAGRT